MSTEQIAALSDRITCTTVLHEHQLWAAVEVLAPGGFEDRTSRVRRRFQALMDADALFDAALLLAAACNPPRQLDTLNMLGGRWRCGVIVQSNDAPARFVAVHPDMAAAALTALLSSFLHTAAVPTPVLTRDFRHDPNVPSKRRDLRARDSVSPGRNRPIRPCRAD